MKTTVCVTGSHRSGTSLVSHILAELGLDLGPRNELSPAGPDNPEGFFENIRIVDFNERLLAHLKGSWHRPPNVKTNWADDVIYNQWVDEARELWSDILDSSPSCFKDPRASITLPVWQRAIPSLKVVHVVRSPSAVVRSLMSRNDMTLNDATAIWTQSVSAVSVHAPECHVVSYEELLRMPDDTIERLAGYVGVDVTASAVALVRPNLDHGTLDPSMQSADMHQAEVLHRLLLSDPEASACLSHVIQEVVHYKWMADHITDHYQGSM